MATYNTQMFYLGNLADLDPFEGANGSENVNDMLNTTFYRPPITNMTVDDDTGR